MKKIVGIVAIALLATLMILSSGLMATKASKDSDIKPPSEVVSNHIIMQDGD